MSSCHTPCDRVWVRCVGAISQWQSILCQALSATRGEHTLRREYSIRPAAASLHPGSYTSQSAFTLWQAFACACLLKYCQIRTYKWEYDQSHLIIRCRFTIGHGFSSTTAICPDPQFTPRAPVHHAQLLPHSTPCAPLGLEPIHDHGGAHVLSVNTTTHCPFTLPFAWV